MTAVTLLRQLDEDDFESVLALRKAVSRDLPENFMRTQTDEEVRACLAGSIGVAWGAEGSGGLLGVGMLHHPSPQASASLGAFPGVPKQDWPGRATFLGGTMVHPDARGAGLQRHLVDARKRYAAASGSRWVCAGAHVQNWPSWRNLLKGGMVVVGMRHDLGFPLLALIGSVHSVGRPMFSVTRSDDVRVIDIEDLTAHESAIAEGLVGLCDAGGGRALVYGPSPSWLHAPNARVAPAA
jgi:GNAT superfamily N-acetyltransferase